MSVFELREYLWSRKQSKFTQNCMKLFALLGVIFGHLIAFVAFQSSLALFDFKHVFKAVKIPPKVYDRNLVFVVAKFLARTLKFE